MVLITGTPSISPSNHKFLAETKPNPAQDKTSSAHYFHITHASKSTTVLIRSRTQEPAPQIRSLGSRGPCTREGKGAEAGTGGSNSAVMPRLGALTTHQLSNPILAYVNLIPRRLRGTFHVKFSVLAWHLQV